MQTKLSIDAADLKQIKAIKKELLTDNNATFTSYARCNDKLKKLADKYKTTTQDIFNATN